MDERCNWRQERLFWCNIYLTYAINEVAEEETWGANQKLLPPGPICQRYPKQRHPLFFPSPHSLSLFLCLHQTLSGKKKGINPRKLERKREKEGIEREQKKRETNRVATEIIKKPMWVRIEGATRRLVLFLFLILFSLASPLLLERITQCEFRNGRGEERRGGKDQGKLVRSKNGGNQRWKYNKGNTPNFSVPDLSIFCTQ